MPKTMMLHTKLNYVKYGYIVIKRSSFFEIWGVYIPQSSHPVYSLALYNSETGSSYAWSAEICYNIFCFNFRVIVTSQITIIAEVKGTCLHSARLILMLWYVASPSEGSCVVYRIYSK